MYRALAGAGRGRLSRPAASLAVVATGRALSSGTAPTRSSRFAPGRPPSVSLTVVTVTVRPMSRSKPVPVFRSPKFGVAYQSVSQPAAGSARTRAAFCGLSPSAVPLGPNATAVTGAIVRGRGGTGVRVVAAAVGVASVTVAVAVAVAAAWDARAVGGGDAGFSAAWPLTWPANSNAA